MLSISEVSEMRTEIDLLVPGNICNYNITGIYLFGFQGTALYT